ncbi:MAG: 6-phosphogluconolactonase [Cyanobacteria bacterium P01_H01_bin.58]
MTDLKIEIYPDRTALIARSLSLVVDCINQAIAERGTCSIALAGGSTPKPLYEALAKVDLPWSQVQVFWGDERYVPTDHADSNAGMAKAAWLDLIPMPADNVHIVPTEYEQPVDAASQYEQTLRRVLGDETWPIVDITLLGMGDDGHTASLFPHTAALSVSDGLVTVGDKGGTPRITFTAPFINQSRHVIFVVAGQNKQTALTQVFATEANEAEYPSRKIQPEGELWWLLDAAAGEPLKEHPQAKLF